jgi:23S rRNA (adenine2503-C2)-methyltransferase
MSGGATATTGRAGPAPVRGAARGPFDVSREELGHLLADQPAYRTGQAWSALYDHGLRPEEVTTLPRAVRERLGAALPPALRAVAEPVSADGQTAKWLWHAADGAAVETVLMLYPGRATVCVSSQAGCAMNCSFCATGQAGFRRNLSTGEILEQVAAARRRAQPRRLSNIVFMGMGEPLANYDRVWGAIERIHGDMGVSARHITVSTVGVVPGIRRLAHEELPVNLAVSLHAANDSLRNSLVPLGRRYPLAELTEACRQYLTAKGRRLSFEWALISGVNDRPSDARELAAMAVPLNAHVNLIPLNPTPGYRVRGTDRAGVRRFRDDLIRQGVNATVRRNRGTDIDAACGQLAASVPVAVAGAPSRPA